MEEKKYLKISFGTAIRLIIIFILILVLVVLWAYTYVIKNENNNKGISSQKQDTSNLSENITNNNTSDLSNENTVKEVGTEISINNTILKTLIEKIDFPTHAIASIYNVGKFNLDNIPNDLILRLGWSKINYNEKTL